MFKHRFSLLRRRHLPRDSTELPDRRTGPPARRRPEPMPRMRWY